MGGGVRGLYLRFLGCFEVRVADFLGRWVFFV